MSVIVTPSPPVSSGSLSAGSLFGVTGFDGMHFFFVASVMKRPVVQVLLQGFKVPRASTSGSDDDGLFEVLLMKPGQIDSTPIMRTAHQAFNDLCLTYKTGGRPTPTTLEVQSYEYRFNPFAPLLRAKVIRSKDSFQFSTSLPKKAKQQSGSLPFGLKLKKRKRKKPAAKEPGAPSQKRATGRNWTSHEIDAKLSSSELANMEPRSDSEQSGDNICCGSSCTESDSSDKVANSGSDQSDESDVTDVGELAEEPVTSASAKAEELQATKIMDQRSDRLEASVSHLSLILSPFEGNAMQQFIGAGGGFGAGCCPTGRMPALPLQGTSRCATVWVRLQPAEVS